MDGSWDFLSFATVSCLSFFIVIFPLRLYKSILREISSSVENSRIAVQQYSCHVRNPIVHTIRRCASLIQVTSLQPLSYISILILFSLALLGFTICLFLSGFHTMSLFYNVALLNII